MKFEKAMPLPCPTLAPADASETSRKGHGKVIDRSLTAPPFQGQGKGNDPHHAGKPDSMTIKHPVNQQPADQEDLELLVLIMELEEV